MSRSILVVAAHPDDEVLGCGATIAKHAKAGDQVHVLILAEGLTSRAEQRDRARLSGELSALAQAAESANRILGAASLRLHDFPDNRMDAIDRLEVVKVIEAAIAEHQPERVYTHHAGDVNIDHRCIHDAVVTACRPLPGHPVKTLLFFEVASSTEWQPPGSGPVFAPTWFEDVSETLDLKLEALEAYRSEMRAWPHARSMEALEHLARWRGASLGVAAAEAFVLGRRLVS
ncbi:1D-myo-inositol 2-acetamido-2-deoxy-alpha-D-glucopyranoside deacetylase [compost metagenome]